MPPLEGTGIRVALIDYGAGNLTSVKKALRAVGAEIDLPRSPSDLGKARLLVVPGVGHFQATSALDQGWRRAVLGTIENGSSLLGICLGMQWLFEGSGEAPDVAGLGLLRGHCRLLPRGGTSADVTACKVPHVGWNSLQVARRSPLLEGIEDGAQMYFTHSYAAPVTPDCLAKTTHGDTFAAVVHRGPISGVQFHPEKSGDAGLRILKNALDAL